MFLGSRRVVMLPSDNNSPAAFNSTVQRGFAGSAAAVAPAIIVVVYVAVLPHDPAVRGGAGAGAESGAARMMLGDEDGGGRRRRAITGLLLPRSERRSRGSSRVSVSLPLPAPEDVFALPLLFAFGAAGRRSVYVGDKVVVSHVATAVHVPADGRNHLRAGSASLSLLQALLLPLTERAHAHAAVAGAHRRFPFPLPASSAAFLRGSPLLRPAAAAATADRSPGLERGQGRVSVSVAAGG